MFTPQIEGTAAIHSSAREFAEVGLLLLVTLDVRGYIASHSASQLPGLSIDQNLVVAWGMVLFWGFVWPWLMIALHMRPLHRLVTQIIGEVDARLTSRGATP
jgi:hypothetical protein